MKGFNVFVAVAAALMLSATVFAEENKKKERSTGYVSGGFETNTNVYLKDAKTLATVPDGHFGSNNYLKVDYITAAALLLASSWRHMLLWLSVFLMFFRRLRVWPIISVISWQ